MNDVALGLVSEFHCSLVQSFDPDGRLVKTLQSAGVPPQVRDLGGSAQISLLASGDLSVSWDPTRLTHKWAWWSADACFQNLANTTPASTSGDPVASMLDQFGNGRNSNQPTGGMRPVIQLYGGKRYVKFDEVNDSLYYFEAMTAGYEIFIVFKQMRTSFPGPNNNVDPLMSSGQAGLSFELTDYNGFGTTAQPYIMVNPASNIMINGAAAAVPYLISGGGGQGFTVSATVGFLVDNSGHYIGAFGDTTHYSPDAIRHIIICSSITSAERIKLHTWGQDQL